MRRTIIWLAMAVAFSGMALAGEPLSLLKFVVLKDHSGKPARNASVIMHPVKDNGKQSRSGLQIKTDADGKAEFDGVPYGKLRVQVIMPGFQTYGGDYDVNQPTQEIVIRIKRPTEQYSIYKDAPAEEKKDAPKAPSEQKPQ